MTGIGDNDSISSKIICMIEVNLLMRIGKINEILIEEEYLYDRYP